MNIRLHYFEIYKRRHFHIGFNSKLHCIRCAKCAPFCKVRTSSTSMSVVLDRDKDNALIVAWIPLNTYSKVKQKKNSATEKRAASWLARTTLLITTRSDCFFVFQPSFKWAMN